MGKKTFLPFSYTRFRKEFPEVEKDYDRLAKKCHAAGPLWAHEVFGEGPGKEVGEG